MAKRFELRAVVDLDGDLFSVSQKLAAIKPAMDELALKIGELGGTVEHDIRQPRGPRQKATNGVQPQPPVEAVQTPVEHHPEQVAA